MGVAVLALQGGFAAHLSLLRSAGVDCWEARGAGAVHAASGLVLPGGESTVMRKLVDADLALREALEAHVRAQRPVLATCAGLIVAAAWGWLDLDVRRNGWGPQLHSAEATADDGTPLMMIRAPRIERVGSGVEVIQTLDGEPVTVRRGALWATTHHPELLDDLWLHRRAFPAPALWHPGPPRRLGPPRETPPLRGR